MSTSKCVGATFGCVKYNHKLLCFPFYVLETYLHEHCAFKLHIPEPNQTSQEYSEPSVREKQLLVIKIFFVSSFFISPLDVSDIFFFKAVTLYYALGLINMYQTLNDQRESKSSIG